MIEQNAPSSDLPKFEEVQDYAIKSVKHFIKKHAFSYPKELQQEIMQDAMLRVWQAYQRIDAAKSWKSFIQRHCSGAVLDYLKAGKGTIESGRAADGSLDGLRKRVEMKSLKDDTPLSVEEVAGLNGIFDLMSDTFSEFKPRWPLLSRMAGVDEDLHIVCKVLLGFTQEEIAVQIRAGLLGTISRERMSQRIYELFTRFDSPDYYDNSWINQCIYALGLSTYYGQRDTDQGVGWEHKSFDLISPLSFRMARVHYTHKGEQLTLWDLDTNITPRSSVANRMVI